MEMTVILATTSLLKRKSGDARMALLAQHNPRTPTTDTRAATIADTATADSHAE